MDTSPGAKLRRETRAMSLGCRPEFQTIVTKIVVPALLCRLLPGVRPAGPARSKEPVDVESRSAA